ncbi:unnamed protein product [Rotaria sp. Silwood1]|nr:unnamed protein product [Rotaria sp. Silwood1]
MAEAQLDSTDPATEVLVASAKLLEQLPETEKKSSFGKALSYIVSGGIIGLEFWTKRGPYNAFLKTKGALESMWNIIDVGKNNQRFIDAIQYQQDNSTLIDNINYQKHFCCSANELKDKIKQCQDSISLETCFKNAINEVKTQMADNVIIKSTKMSSVLIVIQIVKLYFVWKEISKAKNLHNDVTQFHIINQNMEDFQKMCDKLVEAMKSEDVKQTQRIIRRATSKYNKTKALISNLRIEINGSLQRLDLYADMQVLDGISNLASTIGHFVQLRGVFDSLSSPIAFLGGAVVGAFALVTIGNGVTYYITQKRLDELRKDSQQLKLYEHRLDQLYEAIDNAENWLEDK